MENQNFKNEQLQAILKQLKELYLCNIEIRKIF